MSINPEKLLRIDLNEPKDIKVVADLKAIREEKEAKKAAARVRAAATHSHGAAVSSPHGSTPATTTSRRRKATELIFEVLDVTKMQNGNFRYDCEGVEGEMIWFVTSEEKPEYIGKVGMAKYHSYSVVDKEEWYFVKHKAIDWAKMEELPNPEEEKKEETPVGGALFRSANGVAIAADVWHKRIEEEGCDACCKTFRQDEIDKVVIDRRRDVFLCERCAEYQHLWDKSTPTNITH